MSGHSTFSKASAEVLAHFYGTDAITFNTTSDTLAGVVRTFHSFADCADEIGLSRIYGGFHFMFDNTAGKYSGQLVGDYVSANFLLPNDALPLVRLEGFEAGAPLVRVHGHAGQTCVLQASSDLRIWQNIATNQVVTGGYLIRDTRASGAAGQFYRAKEQ